MSAVTHTRLHTGSGEDFGPRADGMVTLHTFENSDPTKNTIRDAIAGAIWQDRQDVAGSYGRIIAVDGVLLTVPDDHASGAINPGSDYWNPEAWLYDFFEPEVVANPNYFTLNLCAMGQRAYYDAHGWPEGIISGFARSILDEERRIGRGVVVTNHSAFQDNRTDAGAICTKLVMARYHELNALPDTALPEDSMHPPLRAVRQTWTTRREPLTPLWIGGPEQGEQKAFGSEQVIETVAETITPDGKSGPWRLAHVNGELVWVRRADIFPWENSRIPATGYGLADRVVEVIKEVPTGISEETLKIAVNTAKQQTADKANAQMDAWTAARPTIKP